MQNSKERRSENEEDDLEAEERICAERYSKSLSRYENALSMDKPVGFFRVILIPGVVLFACTSGYILGAMQFRAWVLVPLLYAVAFVFLRRIREFKRCMEAFVYFSIRKQAISKIEKVNWVNEILEKTWRYAEAAVSKILLLRASAALRKIKIPMVRDVRLEMFTLGGQPPVLEGIRVRHSDRESLVVDASIYFVPSSIEDHRDVYKMAGIEGKDTEWSSNITLMARIGGSTAGIDIPLTLKNVSFRGQVRIKIFLTYGKSLIQGLEFSFLKQPQLSFNIIPLKIVDIMDIPGLSTSIKKAIAKGIEREALYPKRISVSLKPKSTYYVGVVLIHVHRIEAALEPGLFLDMSLDGRPNLSQVPVDSTGGSFTTYLPIKNVDEQVLISIKQQPLDTPLFTARISIEEVCMQSRIQRLLPFAGHPGYVDASFIYFPKLDIAKVPEEERPRAAIVSVKVEQLVDCVDAQGRAFKSVHAKLTAYLREKKEQLQDPASMSAAELMVSQQRSPTLSMANESSTESDESVRPQKSQPKNSPDDVIGVFTTGNARDSISPAFDDKFTFFTRDTKRTAMLVEVYGGGALLGDLTINVRRAIGSAYGTFDFKNARSGRIRLLFSAEYAHMRKIRMRKYTHIREIKIGKLDAFGTYRGYVVTNGRVVPLLSFFSHARGSGHAVVRVPVMSPDELSKIVLYLKNEVFGGCDVITGTAYIGDVQISLQARDAPLFDSPEECRARAEVEGTGGGNASPDVPADASASPNAEKTEGTGIGHGEQKEPGKGEDISALSGLQADASPCEFIQVRVVVCRVTHPIFLVFTRDDTVLDRSPPSSGKNLPGEFFFFANVTVSVYTLKEEYLIGRFHLAKNNGRHEIKLAHGQIFVIDIYNRYASLHPVPLRAPKASVTLHMHRVSLGNMQEIETYASVLFEVDNGKKKETTPEIKNMYKPSIDYTFSSADVFLPLDSVTVKMFGWNLLHEKKMLGMYTLPLESFAPGSTEIHLPVFSVFPEDTSPICIIAALVKIE